jgi:hypothetical protein
MNQPPSELQKLLQHIDQLISQAPDDPSRAELQRLRARLDTQEMLDMARDLARSRPGKAEDLVLEFHDPLLPAPVTAVGCVVAAAVCLVAVIDGFQSNVATVGGMDVNLWLVAAFAGACTAMFSALSFMRTFSVRADTLGMATRSAGARWHQLRVGAMPWKDIRSMHERAADRILEVHAANNAVFEIPMRIVNYAILREHLENMVRLYGDRPAG